MDYAIRFIVGGLMVSLKLRSLFSAAPSVALATLCLALVREGDAYVSVEGRSMILGALALAAYSFAVCQLMMRYRWPALAATTLALVLWLAVALGSQRLLVG